MPIMPGASPVMGVAAGVGEGVGVGEAAGVTTSRAVAPVKYESALVAADLSLTGGAGGTFK
jgi:hypothetical protein